MSESVCDSCGHRQLTPMHDLADSDGARPVCEACGYHCMLTTNMFTSSEDCKKMLPPTEPVGSCNFEGGLTLSMWAGCRMVHIAVEQELMKRFLFHECLFHAADTDGHVDSHTTDPEELMRSLRERLEAGRAAIVTRHEKDPRCWKLLTWDENSENMDAYELCPRARCARVEAPWFVK
jgi:hypothetical protein